MPIQQATRQSERHSKHGIQTLNALKGASSSAEESLFYKLVSSHHCSVIVYGAAQAKSTVSGLNRAVWSMNSS